jgi:hypothetical protein
VLAKDEGVQLARCLLYTGALAGSNKMILTQESMAQNDRRAPQQRM